MKIAFFTNNDFDIFTYRLNLIKKLILEGNIVFACGNKTNQKFVEEIESIGAKFIPLSLKRGIKIFSTIKYFFEVLFLCQKEKFDLCHNFSFKPMVIGSLAQKISGIERIVCSITGLGYAFSSQSLKAKILRIISEIGYFLIGKISNRIIFQNSYNLKYFTQKNIIPVKKSRLIIGSGVDIKYFSQLSANIKNTEKIKEEISFKEKDKIILFVSRLLKQKGVYDFIQSAEILKKYINWKFVLVGPIDKFNPDTIKEKEIEKWKEKENIFYLGERRDIRDILSISDIFIFPSYYQEGAPKVVLEAMAINLPIIAAENKGTEELVKNNINGIIIPPKSPKEIAQSIEKILFNKELSKKFSEKSREIVLNNFSDEVIIKKTLEVYEEI
jgi:N,N'-diacetylbacillosaminyl-diphospho-undecaprenol alpha-1,3-N-acetylgalactosaminyltransferase